MVLQIILSFVGHACCECLAVAKKSRVRESKSERKAETFQVSIRGSRVLVYVCYFSTEGRA
jgi:hypothetical protein